MRKPTQDIPHTQRARRSFLATACGAASLVLWPSRARAGEDDTTGGPGVEGDDTYLGVAPGTGHKNPLPKPSSDGRPRLVWTGFQMTDDTGRVFLQTSQPVPFEVADRTQRQMTVWLRNCQVHLENNQRNLDTRFFPSAVSGVKARQRRKDVEITITLKAPADVTPRQEDGPDGTKFLVLDFPRV